MRPDVAEARILPVSKDVLREAGIDRLMVTSVVSESTLGPLLDELEREDCVHSWQGLLEAARETGSQSRVAALITAEQRVRPTTTFIYFALEPQGQTLPVGAATVAARIHADFPYEGFPVIARAYIARRFRGVGIYPFLVRHRIDYCVEEWGRRLRAVHLGSADPKVWRTVRSDFQFSAPFLHIGFENLKVGSHHHDVKDFLSLGGRFRTRLLEEASEDMTTNAEGTPGYRIGEAMQKFVQAGHSGMPYGQLRDRFDQALEGGHDWRGRRQAMRELVAFCDAIPLNR